MWLQHKVYDFVSLDGNKINIPQILESKLVVNETLTDIELSKLFKIVKSANGNSVNGYGIPEYFNEKGEIDVDGIIYSIRFKHPSNDGTFKLKSFRTPGVEMKDKELTDEEMLVISNLIKSSVSQLTDKETTPPVEVAATTEAQVANDEVSTPEAGVVEEKTVLYENIDYDEERDILVGQGYKEYQTDPKSNYRLLVKKNRSLLVELKENDYEALKLSDYDIKIEDDKLIIRQLTDKKELVNV